MTETEIIAAAARISAGTNVTAIPRMCKGYAALELRLMHAETDADKESILGQMRAHGHVCNCRRVVPVELSNEWMREE